MSEPRAQVEKLEKSFGSKLVLRVEQWRCEPGELVLLSGANGAGKTTFLRTLAGILLPDAGKVHFAVTAARAYSEMGFLLFEALTVREHFDLVQRLKPLSFDSEVIERFGLHQLSDHPAAHLSRGWRVRLGCALALATSPNLLLLDEPFDGLDEAGSAALVAEIARLREQGGTAVIALHHLAPFQETRYSRYHLRAGASPERVS